LDIEKVNQSNAKNHHMKKAILNLIVTGLFITLPVIIASASAPPPPPPGPGGADQPIGGAAPIGSGIVLLVSMGAAYGAKKIYDARKRLEE
jgi:hypothetical protein